MIDNAKVAGRIVAAHSDHDAAVWIAYPLASRVFRDSYSLRLAASQLGQVLGGPTDRYGAIGANGPRNLNGVNRLIFDGASLPALNAAIWSRVSHGAVRACGVTLDNWPRARARSSRHRVSS